MNVIYKIRWFLKQLSFNIITLIPWWPLVAILGIGFSFYQLLVSNNLSPAILIIGSNAWDPIYQDLAISYIGGSILWLLTALLPNEVRKGNLQKQFRKQFKTIYKCIWEDLSKYTEPQQSLYWRPLQWLQYKFPNFDSTLNVILLKVQWIYLLSNNEFKEKYLGKINEIYGIYSDILSYKQRKEIEKLLDKFRELSNNKYYQENIDNLSTAIILLYKLGH